MTSAAGLAKFHPPVRMARHVRALAVRGRAGVYRMRVATLAALAGLVGLASPALALDKVKFGTNWLADPEAGGFFQALADGTYAKYGLDVTIIPGGPQANGALMLLFGRIDFFMGGDLIGDFMSAESKLPLVAVAADFQKSPQILMSHPGVGLDEWKDLPKAKTVYVGAGSINTFYAWLRLVYGFKDEAIRPYNFNSAPFIQNKTSIQQGYRHRRAVRDRKAGRLQAQRLSALRLRLLDVFDLDRDPRARSSRRSLTSCSASSTPPRSAGITISTATIPKPTR